MESRSPALKIHLGCGTVYLDGYVNLDLPSPTTDFAVNRPDLVERYRTTDASYYARHKDKNVDTMRRGPLQQEYVCDTYGDFNNLPAGEIEEILARQCFEHLSISEARRALDQLKRRMKKGAILRLDVPDHHGTLQKFIQTRDEFYIRHLLGPRRNDYGFHMMSYTRERLKALVEEYGFRFVKEEPNIHCYPAFCLRFEKISNDPWIEQAPYQYVQLPAMPATWRVVDIGPGSYPLPRADVYIDRDPRVLEALRVTGDRIVSSLEAGLPEIPDQAFDYAWCSHVLEHVGDPIGCAKTLARIAPRGTIVMPSAFKEALFNFEEATHKWLVLPDPAGGPPIFVRQDEAQIQRLRDVSVQQANCMLYRHGSNHDCTVEKYLHDWFTEKEVDLDVVYQWAGELKLTVIG